MNGPRHQAKTSATISRICAVSPGSPVIWIGFLANEVTREEWHDAARFVQDRIDSTAIEEAMRTLPKDYEKANAQEIEDKLKVRLGKLEEYAEDYYRSLAKQVDVVGSIKDERFVVNRLPDGKVRVQMFELTSRTTTGDLFYDRTFDPQDTKEIRLFGLLGNDQFRIDGEAKRSILIRVVPGQGVDIVADSSRVRKGGRSTRVYSRDDREVIAGSEIKEVDIPYDDAYIYRRTAFHFNTYLPYILAFYSTGNGLQVGGGVNFTRHAYDKPDYSAKHNLAVSASTLGNFHFQYDGSLRHVLGEWDLTLAAQASKHKQFNYFFGLGNESEYNKDSIANGYNTLQYSNVFAEIGLLREFWKRSYFHVAIHLANYGAESGEDNILDDLRDDIPGKEPFRIARLKWDLNVDFLNTKYLPERGMRLVINGQFSEVLNEEGTYSATRGHLEWYGTARPVTISGRLGGWVNHNVPPYYDLEYLGQSSNLRGFRRNRFAGDKGGMFFNANVRIQLVNNTRTLIPHKIGLLLFYDVGRVFQSEEESHDWHHGYGIGVYGVPLRDRFVIGISVAFSKEETGLIRFGFGKLF